MVPSVPAIKRLPGVSQDSLITALDQVLGGLSTAAHGRSKYDIVNSYLSWATSAGSDLGLFFSRNTVANLVLTPAYWHLMGIDPAANESIIRAVHAEAEDRRRHLSRVRDMLLAEDQRWASVSGQTLVPDTNVFLEHRSDFADIPWVQIAGGDPAVPIDVVIPLVVIDELDKTKSDRARGRAAATLREINKCFSDMTFRATLTPQVALHLLMDDADHVRLPRPDQEIAARAEHLRDLTAAAPAIVTFDTGMALRSRAQGLRVIHLGTADHREDGRGGGRLDTLPKN